MAKVEPHPLQWPLGQPRTKRPRNSAFRQLALGKARDDLLHELRLFGAHGVVITTNMPVRRNGLFYASARQPADRGVAVYFTHRRLKQGCLACDHYVTLAENVRALVHTVASMRRIERHGGSNMLETVLSGFSALPPASTVPGWRKVLGDLKSVTEVRRVERKLMLERHPDRGGSHERFIELTDAVDAALAELNPDGDRR